MYTKHGKKVQDGRAQYYGYNIHKQDETPKPRKLSHKFIRKAQKPGRQEKLQSVQKNGISSRKWNTKSQTGSSFSSTVSISSRFRDRIEKACSTYSTADFKKEIFLLKRQIQRLQKEIFRRDKVIFEVKTHAYQNKQAEVELIEAYRAVHFLQGKAKQMEFQIQKFRQTIIKGANGELKPADLSLLFDQLRRQNEELYARLEQQSYNYYLMEDKARKFESKVFELKRQLASSNRKYNDPAQKTLTQRFDRMFEMLEQQKPLDMKEQMFFHEMGSKIKELQKSNEAYKVDVQLLQAQIEDKNIQITLLHKEKFTLKKSRNVVSQKSVQKSGLENDPYLQNFKRKAVTDHVIKQNLEIAGNSINDDLQY